MREGGNTPSLFCLASPYTSASGENFQNSTLFNILFPTGRPVKMYKKILKCFYSLYILPIEISVDICYNNNVPREHRKNRQAKKS